MHNENNTRSLAYGGTREERARRELKRLDASFTYDLKYPVSCHNGGCKQGQRPPRIACRVLVPYWVRPGFSGFAGPSQHPQLMSVGQPSPSVQLFLDLSRNEEEFSCSF